MAILRTVHNDNYSCISNDLVLRNKNLTFKARGILAYMLSCKDDWNFNINSITAMSDCEGRESIRSGLIELEKKGHLKRTMIKKDASHGIYEPDVQYTVYEKSQEINFYDERMRNEKATKEK